MRQSHKYGLIKHVSIVTFFFLLLLLNSCNKDDDSVKDTIIGSWQMIEFYGSDGSNFPEWFSVANGLTYNFQSNDVITSNDFTCNGVWTFNSSNNINITFDCPEAGTLGDYDVTFEEGNLILTPNPSSCDEGCAEKFKRLD